MSFRCKSALASILLASACGAQAKDTLSIVYSFSGPDGAAPYAGLTVGPKGTFYGTTNAGGDLQTCNGGCGTVFALSVKGKHAALTQLHQFHAFYNDDGSSPTAPVRLDADGNIYGTTFYGGVTDPDKAIPQGTVFELPKGGGYAILNTFFADDAGMQHPDGALYVDKKGTLSGTAEQGIDYFCTSGCGAVFEIRKGKLKVLHAFAGNDDGNYPQGGLIADGRGNLYGTTAGGFGSGGTVFAIAPKGKETVLYGSADFGAPVGDLVMDAGGNLYGATVVGGFGYGEVFKLAPDGRLTVLHSFGSGTDGVHPGGGLAMDDAGNLYGTTTSGGSEDAGMLYEITASGKEKVLHNFSNSGNGDGRFPLGGVTLDGAGNLYGTTSAGGASNLGTVFRYKLK